MRLLEKEGVVPVIEPADHQAGITGDSFTLAKAAAATLLLSFGAITGDAVLTLHSGATAGAQTTALPFRYRLSGADYKAAGADQYGAEATDADGSLTLTAATYDHRVLALDIRAEELPAGHAWITLALSNAADVLLVSAVALLHGVRYQPPQTAI